MLRQYFVANKSENPRTNDDQRKWHVKKIDCDKCSQGERPHDRVLERLASNPDDRRGDNGKDRRFQSVKDRRDPWNVSKRDINVTERPKNKDRWNNKESASNNTAARLVQKPADVNGELLCFRTRKQHAKIQRVQKPGIVDPAFFLDQFGVHQGDLTARSAKGNKAKL